MNTTDDDRNNMFFTASNLSLPLNFVGLINPIRYSKLNLLDTSLAIVKGSHDNIVLIKVISDQSCPLNEIRIPESLHLSMQSKAGDTITLVPYEEIEYCTALQVEPQFETKGRNFSKEINEYMSTDSHPVSIGSFFTIINKDEKFTFKVTNSLPGDRCIASRATKVYQINPASPIYYTPFYPTRFSELSLEKSMYEQIKKYICFPLQQTNLIQISKLPTPNGVLILGKSGSGKTSLITAISNSLGFPSVIVDVKRLIALPEKESLEKLKKCFAFPAGKPSSLLLFDDIDVLFEKVRVMPYKRIAAFFVAFVDRLLPNKNTIIVATAKSTESLSSYITRYGRFGFHIKLDELSQKQKVEIIKANTAGFSLFNQNDKDIEFIANNIKSSPFYSINPSQNANALKSSSNFLENSNDDDIVTPGSLIKLCETAIANLFKDKGSKKNDVGIASILNAELTIEHFGLQKPPEKPEIDVEKEKENAKKAENENAKDKSKESENKNEDKDNKDSTENKESKENEPTKEKTDNQNEKIDVKEKVENENQNNEDKEKLNDKKSEDTEQSKKEVEQELHEKSEQKEQKDAQQIENEEQQQNTTENTNAPEIAQNENNEVKEADQNEVEEKPEETKQQEKIDKKEDEKVEKEVEEKPEEVEKQEDHKEAENKEEEPKENPANEQKEKPVDEQKEKSANEQKEKNVDIQIENEESITKPKKQVKQEEEEEKEKPVKKQKKAKKVEEEDEEEEEKPVKKPTKKPKKQIKQQEEEDEEEEKPAKKPKKQVKQEEEEEQKEKSAKKSVKKQKKAKKIEEEDEEEEEKSAKKPVKKQKKAKKVEEEDEEEEKPVKKPTKKPKKQIKQEEEDEEEEKPAKKPVKKPKKQVKQEEEEQKEKTTKKPVKKQKKAKKVEEEEDEEEEEKPVKKSTKKPKKQPKQVEEEEETETTKPVKKSTKKQKKQKQQHEEEDNEEEEEKPAKKSTKKQKKQKQQQQQEEDNEEEEEKPAKKSTKKQKKQPMKRQIEEEEDNEEEEEKPAKKPVKKRTKKSDTQIQGEVPLIQPIQDTQPLVTVPSQSVLSDADIESLMLEIPDRRNKSAPSPIEPVSDLLIDISDLQPSEVQTKKKKPFDDPFKNRQTAPTNDFDLTSLTSQPQPQQTATRRKSRPYEDPFAGSEETKDGEKGANSASSSKSSRQNLIEIARSLREQLGSDSSSDSEGAKSKKKKKKKKKENSEKPSQLPSNSEKSQKSNSTSNQNSKKNTPFAQSKKPKIDEYSDYDSDDRNSKPKEESFVSNKANYNSPFSNSNKAASKENEYSSSDGYENEKSEVMNKPKKNFKPSNQPAAMTEFEVASKPLQPKTKNDPFAKADSNQTNPSQKKKKEKEQNLDLINITSPQPNITTNPSQQNLSQEFLDDLLNMPQTKPKQQQQQAAMPQRKKQTAKTAQTEIVSQPSDSFVSAQTPFAATSVKKQPSKKLAFERNGSDDYEYDYDNDDRNDRKPKPKNSPFEARPQQSKKKQQRKTDAAFGQFTQTQPQPQPPVQQQALQQNYSNDLIEAFMSPQPTVNQPPQPSQPQQPVRTQPAPPPPFQPSSQKQTSSDQKSLNSVSPLFYHIPGGAPKGVVVRRAKFEEVDFDDDSASNFTSQPDPVQQEMQAAKSRFQLPTPQQQQQQSQHKSHKRRRSEEAANFNNADDDEGEFDNSSSRANTPFARKPSKKGKSSRSNDSDKVNSFDHQTIGNSGSGVADDLLSLKMGPEGDNLFGSVEAMYNNDPFGPGKTIRQQYGSTDQIPSQMPMGMSKHGGFSSHDYSDDDGVDRSQKTKKSKKSKRGDPFGNQQQQYQDDLLNI